MAKVFRRGVTWILVAPVKAVLETAATALQSYTGQLKIQGWPGLKCVPDQPGLLSDTGKEVKGREHKSYPHYWQLSFGNVLRVTEWGKAHWSKFQS